MSLKYSLFALKSKEFEIKSKLHRNEQDGTMDKYEEEMLKSHLESLNEGIKVLEERL